MQGTLILGHEDRGINFDSAYDYWRDSENTTVEILNKKDQSQLKSVFKKLKADNYQVVILDLPFKRTHKQTSTLRSIPKLCIYEEDACQDRIESSKWHGKFTRFYHKIPHARVIFTGYQTYQHFSDRNVDAHFVGKGFNHKQIRNTGTERDIEAAFVGRLSSGAYAERANLVKSLVDYDLIQQLRCAPEDYNHLLNRIKVFVSADIGLGEYMAKNFEAMAAGCVVLAYEQGKGEEDAQGLIEGENIVLYKDQQDAIAKLAMLKANPQLVSKISCKAIDSIASTRRHIDIAKQVLSIAQQPYADRHKPVSTFSRLFQLVNR